MGASAAPCMPLARVSQPHRLCQGVVCFQVVVCVSRLASDTAVASEAEDSGSDRRPLGFGQGHGQFVQGEDVGSGHVLCLN